MFRLLRLPDFYVPPQVNISQLKGNGKLLTDKEIERVKIKLKDMPENRYSKRFVGLSYGIVKGKRTYYAIYYDLELKKEFVLGAGSFGAAKLIQDLNTGEWRVLKTQKMLTRRHRETAEHEYIMSREVKLTCESPTTRESKEGIPKHNMVEYYIPGMDLFDLITQANDSTSAVSKRPILYWIKIIIQLLELLRLLQKMGILHCDIKPENIKVNEEGNVYILDYAFSEKCTDRLVFRKKDFCGSLFYVAPELAKKNSENHKIAQKGGDLSKLFLEYSAATDMYAVAATIVFMCFGKPEIPEVKTSSGTFRKVSAMSGVPCLLNYFTEVNLDKGRMICEELYHDHPKKRLDLNGAIQLFKNIEKEVCLTYPTMQKELEEMYKSLKIAEEERLNNIKKILTLYQALESYHQYKKEYFGVRQLFSHHESRRMVALIEYISEPKQYSLVAAEADKYVDENGGRELSKHLKTAGFGRK